MHKQLLFPLLLLFSVWTITAQTPIDTTEAKQDSIKKRTLVKQIGNGFFPTKFWNFDLRYLVKYNQYEGLRTGLGGITNNDFSEKYRINSYLVYGFKDDKFKYKIGGGFRVAPKTDTWINLSYTDDLQETGSTVFLTDKRFFQFFEPRLLNIDLFHKHITKAINIEHKLASNLLSETEFAVSNVSTTYAYSYNLNNTPYSEFEYSTAKLALQWSPFSQFEVSKSDEIKEVKNGYPKFTFQYTKNFKGVFNSDFNFSKIDFRTIQKFTYSKESFSLITLTSGFANGDTPLTHLYHSYPNNITKETILQRFSVAGINSFETMYFNEFFSDRYATFQFKHYFKPFNISNRFKPQLVLITRAALGDMKNIQRHQGISFSTLDKGYTESGFELNKLLFGFGLSCAYRYGAYHLPLTEDNFAVKFTFNITL